VVRGPCRELDLAPVDAVEQRPRDAYRDPVAERVFGSPGLESRRKPGQHRGVTERVAGTQHVEQPPVVNDVDRPRVDHAQERDRPAVLGQDRGARDVELDLGLRRDLAELLGR
jgi:hypothetical protein